MINNRQNGRRGRGRGNNGMRPMGGGGQDRGNRIDNRARGNANQLHEKYKTLARDAQMQGDRVMTEYYHQFADHYFRVLSETRGRFEDQQQRRQSRDFQDDFDDSDGDGEAGQDNGDRDEEQPRQQRRDQGDNYQAERGQNERSQAARGQAERGERQPRFERRERDGNGERETYRANGRDAGRDNGRDEPRRDERPQPARSDIRSEEAGQPIEAERRPRGRPRRERAEEAPRMEGDQLPAFLTETNGMAGPQPAAVSDAEGEERPRVRRVRRPRPDEAGAPAEA